MASLNHIVLGILILHINVYAAPNDVSKLEEIAKVEQAVPIVEQSDPKAEQSDPKLDSEPKEVESDSNDETKRHKRWYNPYSNGFPPFNPFYNPGFDKRDEGSNTGYYGEDPLAQIHRRVQEIAHFVRQPQQQPLPPPHFPIFYPVLFIPPVGCNCNNENPNLSTPEPDTAVTPPYSNGDDNNTDGNNTDGNSTDSTTPTVASRWPVMEDERQNWGLVVNENDSEEGVDFARPISFDPIKLNKPVMRPAPPVDHGTEQNDANNQNRPQSEAPSAQTTPTRPQPQPQTTRRPSQSFNRPQNSQPTQSPSSGLAPPSRCDGAILTCCHQPQVTYDCFAIQGCSDLSGYGSPCAPSQIVKVIERFQTYYGQRGQ